MTPGPHDRQAAFAEALTLLAAADPQLRAVVTAYGRPAFWSRPPGLASLALLILEQQVSLASAAATYAALVNQQGEMSAAALLHNDAMRAAGVSRQKERYLRSLATAVDDGTLVLADLADAPDEQVRATLMSLPGIGRWTADVYLLVCLGRPDLWPTGDRALAVGTAETLDLDTVPDAIALDEIGARWRPHRSAAAQIIWHGYLNRRGRSL